MSSYARRIGPLLSTQESAQFKKLTSPSKIQNFLDRMPINFELSGQTFMSPRRVLREHKAHCFEGALLAAAALALQDRQPLILDLRSIMSDEDHVIALFVENGRWGAISKTNHATLRWRDPIFHDPSELALSYVHEFFTPDGRKTMRKYSAPFDLSRYAPERWVVAEEELEWLVLALDCSRHFPIAPEKNIRQLRPATKFEIHTTAALEWKPPPRSKH